MQMESNLKLPQFTILRKGGGGKISVQTGFTIAHNRQLRKCVMMRCGDPLGDNAEDQADGLHCFFWTLLLFQPISCSLVSSLGNPCRNFSRF